MASSVLNLATTVNLPEKVGNFYPKIGENFYNSTGETLATILTPGYFPDNFGSLTVPLRINDYLLIRGSDGVVLTYINDVAPVSLVTAITGIADANITSFTMTVGGIWAADQAFPMTLHRANGVVTASIPAVIAAATNSDQITTTANLIPSGFRPTITKNCLLIVENNSIQVVGRIAIDTSGQITIDPDLLGNDFTPAGSGGTISQDITYTLS